MRKFDKVSARLSFSPKYCWAVAENAIKPLIFMYHEALSIFLGSTIPSHTDRSPPGTEVKVGRVRTNSGWATSEA